MGKQRTFVFALLATILAVLVYLQFRTWKGFDWATFWSQFKHLNPLHIANGVVLIYASHLLRARQSPDRRGWCWQAKRRR